MSDTDVRWMDLNAFCDEGFLQEANRLFFHPHGLALAVEYDEDTEQVTGIAGVWDYRDDPEGMIFGSVDADKVRHVRLQRLVHYRTRAEMFQRPGHIQMSGDIQPTKWAPPEEEDGYAGNE